jgi:hypothetical protein
LRNLTKQIEYKISEKNQLHISIAENLSLIKKTKQAIKSTNKTIFEKIIEIISFNLLAENIKCNNASLCVNSDYQ